MTRAHGLRKSLCRNRAATRARRRRQQRGKEGGRAARARGARTSAKYRKPAEPRPRVAEPRSAPLLPPPALAGLHTGEVDTTGTGGGGGGGHVTQGPGVLKIAFRVAAGRYFGDGDGRGSIQPPRPLLRRPGPGPRARRRPGVGAAPLSLSPPRPDLLAAGFSRASNPHAPPQSVPPPSLSLGSRMCPLLEPHVVCLQAKVAKKRLTTRSPNSHRDGCPTRRGARATTIGRTERHRCDGPGEKGTSPIFGTLVAYWGDKRAPVCTGHSAVFETPALPLLSRLWGRRAQI